MDSWHETCYAGLSNAQIGAYIKDIVHILEVFEHAIGTRKEVSGQSDAEIEKIRRGLVGVDPATYYPRDTRHCGLPEGTIYSSGVEGSRRKTDQAPGVKAKED
jgi:hypothetical protein